jgi:hypothetical protein
MTQISDDVCVYYTDGYEYETVAEYYKSIQYYNKMLIELNNPCNIFDPSKIIDLINTKYDYESCCFCKYKLEYDRVGRPYISLYGHSGDAVGLFIDFCDFYDGENGNATLEIIGTEKYEARKLDRITSLSIHLNRPRKRYINYDKEGTVYKFQFDYYGVYEWIKTVLIKEIKERKENCYDEANEYGVLTSEIRKQHSKVRYSKERQKIVLETKINQDKQEIERTKKFIESYGSAKRFKTMHENFSENQINNVVSDLEIAKERLRRRELELIQL